MCCSLLLKLNDILSEENLEKLREFFEQLTPNTSDKITAEKLASYMGVDFSEARNILMKCKKIGVLELQFAVRCPECGALIKQAKDFEELFNVDECYVCGSEIEISEEDIVLIFSLDKDKFPFDSGQHKIRDNAKSVVAQENSIEKFVKEGHLNAILYNPTDEDYAELKKLCELALQAKTKKEKGESLEKTVIFLFNMGNLFSAEERKITNNQIDCIVTNRWYTHCGIFDVIGGHFLVECKNETRRNKKDATIEGKPPKGSYLSKLHSIITETQKNHTYVKFGVIVSRGKAPKTYHEHAVKYKMLHDVVIIHFTLNEILDMAINKENLLDKMDEKIKNIIIDIDDYKKAIGE